MDRFIARESRCRGEGSGRRPGHWRVLTMKRSVYVLLFLPLLLLMACDSPPEAEPTAAVAPPPRQATLPSLQKAPRQLPEASPVPTMALRLTAGAPPAPAEAPIEPTAEPIEPTETAPAAPAPTEAIPAPTSATPEPTAPAGETAEPLPAGAPEPRAPAPKAAISPAWYSIPRRRGPFMHWRPKAGSLRAQMAARVGGWPIPACRRLT
jgi:hypothetical protein